ncbi:S1 family peptidase [Piscinibacter sp.]|uniref:S1 family peptidase n=1 Tax=Piscinibacter sp. TaxID=1903157 RepID=UPI0039E34D72
MLPTNIAYRTFFVRLAQYGTAFTLDIDGAEYLITAAHLLPAPNDREVPIQIYFNKQWLSGTATVVGRGRGELDIAVLRVATRLTPTGFPVTASMGSVFVGQDVFFVGYPYKMSVDYGEPFAGLPGPFLKKGALSAVTLTEPKVLYVDALNNEGFSGGPLYFFRNNNPQEPYIAGVVSKYRVEPESVLDAEGAATGMTVHYNTGFLVAYDIKHALEFVQRRGGA